MPTYLKSNDDVIRHFRYGDAGYPEARKGSAYISELSGELTRRDEQFSAKTLHLLGWTAATRWTRKDGETLTIAASRWITAGYHSYPMSGVADVFLANEYDTGLRRSRCNSSPAFYNWNELAYELVDLIGLRRELVKRQVLGHHVTQEYLEQTCDGYNRMVAFFGVPLEMKQAITRLGLKAVPARLNATIFAAERKAILAEKRKVGRKAAKKGAPVRQQKYADAKALWPELESVETSPERLNAIWDQFPNFEDAHISVWRKLARNPNTPGGLLLDMARSLRDQHVDYDVLQNPVWPLLLLENPAVYGKLHASLQLRWQDQCRPSVGEAVRAISVYDQPFERARAILTCLVDGKIVVADHARPQDVPPWGYSLYNKAERDALAKLKDRHVSHIISEEVARYLLATYNRFSPVEDIVRPELIVALDEWLSNGNFLPEAWKRKE
jgi:hypothetical protein